MEKTLFVMPLVRLHRSSTISSVSGTYEALYRNLPIPNQC